MAEVAAHVKTLRDQGASKMIMVGHSMGVPAAMSHAARGGDVQALVLLAPGHIPRGYDISPQLKAARDSIDEARALVAAGKGYSLFAIRASVSTTSTKASLQCWWPPPKTACRISTLLQTQRGPSPRRAAPRLPPALAVLTAMGKKAPLLTPIRACYVDKLPADPKNKTLEVAGGHLETAREASDDIVP